MHNKGAQSVLSENIDNKIAILLRFRDETKCRLKMHEFSLKSIQSILFTGWKTNSLFHPGFSNKNLNCIRFFDKIDVDYN